MIVPPQLDHDHNANVAHRVIPRLHYGKAKVDTKILIHHGSPPQQLRLLACNRLLCLKV